MPHTIAYNPELRIVETTVQGMMTLSDLKQYFAETARLASRHKCSHILADFRNVTPKISNTEIYELPQMIVKIYGDTGVNARATRRAVVVAQRSSEYTFYETVTVNSGQNAKMFFDMEKAKEWLLGK